MKSLDEVVSLTLTDALEAADPLSAINKYFLRFPNLHKPADMLLNAYTVHAQCNLPFFVFTHDPITSTSASSDQLLISQATPLLPSVFVQNVSPPIVKTVTLSIGHGDNHTHLLVSQLGDRPICEDQLRRISAATGLALHKLKHCTINHHLDPVSHFGRAPGMVGPFPDSHTDLQALIYFAADAPPFVALRYTPIDTVFMARQIFESLVRTHCELIELQLYCISD